MKLLIFLLTISGSVVVLVEFLCFYTLLQLLIWFKTLLNILYCFKIQVVLNVVCSYNFKILLIKVQLFVEYLVK